MNTYQSFLNLSRSKNCCKEPTNLSLSTLNEKLVIECKVCGEIYFVTAIEHYENVEGESNE